jgi:SAM-dependent methyltransferase
MRRLPTVFLLALGVVLVAVVHVASEGWLEEHTKGHVPVGAISYTAGALAAVIFIVAAEWASEGLYGASALVRRAHHWLTGELYLEGWWLDVGIDDHGGLAEVKNCSFITIAHDEEEELHVEGLSWETQSPNVFIWRSFYAKLDKKTLYFGHEYTSSQAGLATDGKQTSRFSFHLDGASFDGGFDADRYRSIGRLYRRNDALRSRRRELTEAERRRLAQENMQRFIRENGYDPATYRQMSARPLLERKEWFLTFTKATNRKEAERALLVQLMENMAWPRPVRQVLELGPGSGVLPIAALTLGMPDLADARYIGVDCNGSLLDELAAKLQLQCGRREDGRTVLRRQSIEEFLAGDDGVFELILVLHSFYFVRGLDTLLPRLWHKLAPGGRLVAMHSELASAGLVTTLLTRFNPAIERNVVATLEASAARAGVTKLSSLASQVDVSFPNLTGDEWRRVQDNAAGEAVGQAVALLSFLMDRAPTDLSPQDWRNAVKALRGHLAVNRNVVRLPLVAQVFERP